MKEFAVYTAARLGLFLAAYALIVGVYLLMNGGGPIPLLWPFVIAVLVSAIASAYLLRTQRENFARAIQQRAERSATRRRMVQAEQDRADADRPIASQNEQDRAGGEEQR